MKQINNMITIGIDVIRSGHRYDIHDTIGIYISVVNSKFTCIENRIFSCYSELFTKFDTMYRKETLEKHGILNELLNEYTKTNDSYNPTTNGMYTYQKQRMIKEFIDYIIYLNNKNKNNIQIVCNRIAYTIGSLNYDITNLNNQSEKIHLLGCDCNCDNEDCISHIKVNDIDSFSNGFKIGSTIHKLSYIRHTYNIPKIKYNSNVKPFINYIISGKCAYTLLIYQNIDMFDLKCDIFSIEYIRVVITNYLIKNNIFNVILAINMIYFIAIVYSYVKYIVM